MPSNLWDDIASWELIKSYQELEKKLGQPKEEDTPAETLKADTPADGLKGIDFNSIQNEFEEHGSLSDETMKNLEASGLPKSYVDNYIEGIKAVATRFETQAHDSVGGKEEYGKMPKNGGSRTFTIASCRSWDRTICILNQREKNEMKCQGGGYSDDAPVVACNIIDSTMERPLYSIRLHAREVTI